MRSTEKHARKEDGSEKKKRPKKEKGGGIFPKRIPYAILVLLMGLAAAALMAAMIVVDLLPTNLTLAIIAMIVIMLAVSSLLLARRKRWKRILGILVSLLFIVVLGGLTYYLTSSYAMLNQISEKDDFSNAEKKGASIDPTEEAFNVYITGIDQWASEKGLDLERSDVNMIVTVNPKTKEILLTSIPRDTYVKLHSLQAMDKLTHSGVYGVDETLDTVEDWLNIDLSYYIKMNFTAARRIINAMGGIDLYNPVAFESSLKGYQYEQGWIHLSGKRALYYARERHAFEGQDSIRVENQQRVMKAMIKKMTSSTTLLTKYGEIMKVAGENLHTSMSYDEIRALVKMQMADLAEWDIQTQKIEGEYDMDYVASLTQSQKFSIYRADPESVTKCVEAIRDVMNPTAEELEEAEAERNRSYIDSMIRLFTERNKNSGEDEVQP